MNVAIESAECDCDENSRKDYWVWSNVMKGKSKNCDTLRLSNLFWAKNREKEDMETVVYK